MIRRTLTALTLAVTCATGLALGVQTASQTPSGAATSYPLPDLDPFYQAPANIAAIGDGQIVASRPSNASIKLLGATVPLTGAWQLSFRSNDAHNKPILAVTTVLVPKQAYTGKSPARPMVTYTTAEDSNGTQCAPSYTLATGSNVLTGAEQNLMSVILLKGYMMNVPDHEGPLSAEMAGPLEGRIILDSVRAALSFSAAGTSASTPVGLWGYSASGGAIGWAAELEGTYAPDLANSIKAIAFGGAPVDVANTLNRLNGGPFVGFALSALVGLDKAYPEVGIYGLLNAKGRAVYAQVDQHCVADYALKTAFTNINSLSDTPNVIRTPRLVALLKSLNLLQARPIAPVYYYYAPTDEAVPLADSLSLWRGYCAMGNPTISSVIARTEHVVAAVVAAPGVLSYLENRFSGVPIYPWEPCHL